MLDFHTHILPCMDDGSCSAEESVKMLKSLKEQGVQSVVLSPHFYAYRTDVNSFINMRNRSFNMLLEKLENERLDMSLAFGCEVLYFEEIWRIESIEKLCVEGTKMLLVEMPFARWEDSYIDTIQKLSARGVIPVIAHIDRYIRFHNDKKRFYQLTAAGALLQMNTDYLTNFFTREKALSLIKKGLVTFVGTDCHNMGSRKPVYDKAWKIVKKNIPEKTLKKLITNQELHMEDADIMYV